jgi:hypothetical protein
MEINCGGGGFIPTIGFVEYSMLHKVKNFHSSIWYKRTVAKLAANLTQPADAWTLCALWLGLSDMLLLGSHTGRSRGYTEYQSKKNGTDVGVKGERKCEGLNTVSSTRVICACEGTYGLAQKRMTLSKPLCNLAKKC